MTKIRVYDLARELRQDINRIIEDVKREGIDVSVPSAAISVDVAERIRNRYFPKIEITPRKSIKVLKSYGIAKGKSETTFKCLKCGAEVEHSDLNCRFCGFLVEKTKKHLENIKIKHKKIITKSKESFSDTDKDKNKGLEKCSFCGLTENSTRHQRYCKWNPQNIQKREAEPKFEKVRVNHKPLPPEKFIKGRCSICEKNFPMAQSNICYECKDK